MKKYIKVYLKEMGYDQSDFIRSEISGQKANDIHHIVCRGMGGSKNKDYIENLIALTREEHEKFGDKKEFILYLYVRHAIFMAKLKLKFDVSKIDLRYQKDVKEAILT